MSQPTDGTGDYGEDEAEGTWRPVDTRLEIQFRSQEKLMSDFDDWFKEKYGYGQTRQGKANLQYAFTAGFNAGMERAMTIACEIEEEDPCKYAVTDRFSNGAGVVAVAIRAEVEDEMV
jgi:hypothetical protein